MSEDKEQERKDAVALMMIMHRRGLSWVLKTMGRILDTAAEKGGKQ